MILLVIIMTVLSLFAFISFLFVNSFSDAISDEEFSDASIKNLENVAYGITFMDFGILLGLVVFCVLLIGFNFMVVKNPVFLILDVIFFIPLIVFSGSISEFFVDLGSSPDFVGVVSNFYYSYQVLTNFPVFILVLGLLVLSGVYVGGVIG